MNRFFSAAASVAALLALLVSVTGCGNSKPSRSAHLSTTQQEQLAQQATSLGRTLTQLAREERACAADNSRPNQISLLTECLAQKLTSGAKQVRTFSRSLGPLAETVTAPCATALSTFQVSLTEMASSFQDAADAAITGDVPQLKAALNQAGYAKVRRTGRAATSACQ